MKRSGSKKGKETTAFLYECISRDDNLDGDSYSVANQKSCSPKERTIPIWFIPLMTAFQA